MSTINFEAILFKRESTDNLGSGILLRLPESASAKLPSRGMTMIEGTLNDVGFRAVVEPDGAGSHWFKVNDILRDVAGIKVGDTVKLSIEPTKEWREPKVPTALKSVLADNPQANKVWQSITPMARWDWIRWIGAAKQEETRQRRVEIAVSKLKSGMRRPCCFNRTECTLTDA